MELLIIFIVLIAVTCFVLFLCYRIYKRRCYQKQKEKDLSDYLFKKQDTLNNFTYQDRK